MVTGVFPDILFANVTNITVQGVTVWAAWGQDLLGIEVWEVHQALVAMGLCGRWTSC
jgi:hypothetical protein